MKKNLYKAILAAGIVFLLAGCAKSDHLDTVPSYEYSSENVWKSADLAKAAVTGIYSMLYTLWIQVGAGNHATDTWASVMDPVNNWLGWNIILDGNLRPSNGNVVSMYWGPLYEVVRRSNDVIFHIDQVPDDQLSAAERAELKCEALFFRAYAYYYLATMWGDVPLITTEMTEDELLQISRSPQKTVYEQCVADLTECVNNPTLPGRTTNGRVSKGAAYAYRGFVYQFLGDSQKALSDYEAIGNLGFALFSPHDGAPGNRDFHDLLLPEKYDYNEQRIIDNIIMNRKHGKTHHLIINAEGIGHSTSMARRIEAATGIETRATILGYLQRGGNPTCKDRVYATTMGAYAADILTEGKSNRVVCYRNGEFIDDDIEEALAMQKSISDYQYEVAMTIQ